MERNKTYFAILISCIAVFAVLFAVLFSVYAEEETVLEQPEGRTSEQIALEKAFEFDRAFGREPIAWNVTEYNVNQSMVDKKDGADVNLFRVSFFVNSRQGEAIKDMIVKVEFTGDRNNITESELLSVDVWETESFER